MTLEQLKYLRESEDKVEFKSATANFAYNGGTRTEQTERRKCFLGYIVALANEGGGRLVLGMNDEYPHQVVGSDFAVDEIGKLEDDVYEKLKIRVHIKELFDDYQTRVVLTKVPSRPIGRVLKFEGVPLMRTGESIRNMSDEELFAILSEQEEDFSAKVCPTLTIEALDEKAVETLKLKYADKQKNKNFLTQDREQVLIDLSMMKPSGQLTYAALILLGRKDTIKSLLPQAAINLEYRSNVNSIPFDNRNNFQGPYFLIIDEIWKIIDARNKNKHIQIGPVITDIPELNQEVIREAINNAVAHRDYSKSSEILIKQSDLFFSVSSHGGLPLGVNRDNILTVNSTPRNRLLADVLTKTGFVERSGQGVDKIYKNTLSDGKGFPSYDDTDFFQVTVNIPVPVRFPAFSLFINDLQSRLSDQEKLGVHHIITLAKIRKREQLNPRDREAIPKLMNIRAITETNESYLLSTEYSKFVEAVEGSDLQKIEDFIKRSGSVKMGDVLSLFSNRLTRRQVNNIVYNMVENGILIKKGVRATTTYEISNEKAVAKESVIKSKEK